MSFDPAVLERLIADGAALDALAYAERAFHEAPDDPVVRSYFGYLEATERGRLRIGLEHCEAALSRPGHPAYVELNAARVYVKAKRKQDAVQCLRAGLEREPEQQQLLAELSRLGTRRRPVLARLPRASLLNKLLGRLAARLARR